jgi:Mn-dependent DtxR family transcriptional regulator
VDLAEKIYERHRVLTAFLEKIGVSPEAAEEDACKIEHRISDESLEAIKKQL